MFNQSQNIKNKTQKIILLSQVKSDKKQFSRKNTFTKGDEKLNFLYELDFKNISHTNEENTEYNHPKLDSMILYKDKIKNFKKKKTYSTTDLLTSSDFFNDKTNDSYFFSNIKSKTKMSSTSRGNSSMVNKIIGLNKVKGKKKNNKKVKFKKKFVSYIEIESFKKYNMENNSFNVNDNKTDTKCTCLMF